MQIKLADAPLFCQTKAIAAFLFFIVFDSHAQITGFNGPASQSLVSGSVEKFWKSESQIIKNGTLVKIIPPLDKDLNKLIISNEVALNIINDSYLVGNAMWCDLDWKKYYINYMQNIRKEKFTQIQVAYIGFLFGIGQGELFRTIKSTGKCPVKTQEIIKKALNKVNSGSKRNSLGFKQVIRPE